MYIPLSDDKHRKVRDSSKKCAGNLRQFSMRQNAVQDKIQSQECFPMVRKNFFWTEFCLRLNFVLDWICLRLHTAVVFCMQAFNFLNFMITFLKLVYAKPLRFTFFGIWTHSYVIWTLVVITCQNGNGIKSPWTYIYRGVGGMVGDYIHDKTLNKASNAALMLLSISAMAGELRYVVKVTDGRQFQMTDDQIWWLTW